MLSIRLDLNQDENIKIKEIFSRMNDADYLLHTRLMRCRISKNIHNNHWHLEVFIDFINRNKSEIDSIFGEDNEIKFLSLLFGEKICLKEVMNLSIDVRTAKPFVSYDLSIPVSLKDFILSTAVGYELPDDAFPYLKSSKIATLKPTETWLEWLQRLSEESQTTAFMNMLNDIIAQDCIDLKEIDQHQFKIVYFINNMTRPENVEFVEYMVKRTSLVNEHEIIKMIEANAMRVIALNNIINVKKES